MNESYKPSETPSVEKKEELSPEEAARALQESIEQPELKDRITRMVRERGGFGDPEVQALIGEWRDKAEAEVAKTRERRPGVLLDMATADFYLAADDPTEAVLTLLWAKVRLLKNSDSEYKLSDEGMSEDLIDEIEKKISTIAAAFGVEAVDAARQQIDDEIGSRV